MPLKKKINSETKDFWLSVERASRKIKKWPKWKRNLKVTQYSVNFDLK